MAKPNVNGPTTGKLSSIVIYTSVPDYGDVFLSNMDRLYLLAYLLTGNRDMAERCFVEAIDHCINGNSVFKEWALSWARRAIIKIAIRMISPEPEGYDENLNKDSHRALCGRAEDDLLNIVMQLKPFERCAFVISVLERFSDHECSLLLESTRGQGTRGKRSAIEHLTSVFV